MSGTKFIAGWKPMLVRYLKQKRPLSVAAGLVGVGLGKLQDERRRDSDFDKQVQDALDAPRGRLQW